MKLYRIYTFLLVLFLSALGSGVAWGQDAWPEQSGAWPYIGGNINGDEDGSKGDNNYYLGSGSNWGGLFANADTGGTLVFDDEGYIPKGGSGSPLYGTMRMVKDINLSATITIRRKASNNKPTQLVITNVSGRPLYIRNTSASTLSAMFRVEEGAYLALIGKPGAEIIIDAGANFTWTDNYPDNYTLTPGSGSKSINGGVIESRGTLILEHVIIQNANITKGDRGAIQISPWEKAIWQEDANGDGKKDNPKTQGSTHLKKCEITLCKSNKGSAINVNAETDCEGSTAENCAIHLNDVKIHKCYTSANESTWGGITRTVGTVVGSMYFKNLELSHCYAEEGCAGVYWNAAGHLKDDYSTDTKCIFRGNNKLHHNITAMEGGAMRIEMNMDFEGLTEVYNNYAHDIGGGIHVYGYAGGLLTEEVCSFIHDLNENLYVHDNEAKNYGGGIAIQYRDVFKLKSESAISTNINGARVENNKAGFHDTSGAGCGGGISFYEDSYDANKKDRKFTIEVNLNSGSVSNNKARVDGGGIYAISFDSSLKKYTAQVSLNSGSINNNVAENGNGGGIYIYDTDLTSKKGAEHRVDIDNNNAKKSGGGVYQHNANLTLQDVHVTNNTAAGSPEGSSPTAINDVGNGGGVFMDSGSFTMASGEVSNNKSTVAGGGIYVNNPSTTGNPMQVRFSGGDLISNKSYLGGGICVRGNVAFTMDNASFERNTATNGGGIFVTGGGKMTYSNGLIRYNTAVGSTDLKTAYGYGPFQNRGIGGGIYINTNSSLEFSESISEFGIYGNLADHGADDVFAAGSNTTIRLPRVQTMSLKGFSVPVPVGALYWVEDYVTEDEEYKKGLDKISDGSIEWHQPKRYRYCLANLEAEHIHKLVEPGDLERITLSTYLCLTLGYAFVYVTIEKSGMMPNENAMFNISRKNDNNTYQPYLNLVLSDLDKGTDGIRRKRVALTEGIWKIAEDPSWSWAYTIASPIFPSSDDPTVIADGVYERTIDMAMPKEDRIFRFSNTEDTPVLDLHYDETINENKFN